MYIFFFLVKEKNPNKIIIKIEYCFMQPFIVKQVDDTYDNKSGLTSSGDNWQHMKKSSLRILMLKNVNIAFPSTAKGSFKNYVDRIFWVNR